MSSLYHSETLRHRLTINEFIDNILVAILLFLLVFLLKHIINRIVYMRTRFSGSRETITYFSQARIVLLDNSFLFCWVRKFRPYDAGQYAQRNHIQYNLVVLATLAMFILEFGLVIPVLPTNRPIYRDFDKIARWESEYLDKCRIILSNNYTCAVPPVLDGPNVKSESSWTYCQILVMAYIGTLVPAFFIFVSTASTVLVHIAVCIFLKSPARSAWELVHAHVRDYGDRIPAGPPDDARNIQKKPSNREGNLQ